MGENARPVKDAHQPCPLCDRAAHVVEWEIRREFDCSVCGRYSISHSATDTLTELSGAGRAVVGDAMRRHVKTLHANAKAPLVLEEDVKKAASRLA